MEEKAYYKVFDKVLKRIGNVLIESEHVNLKRYTG